MIQSQLHHCARLSKRTIRNTLPTCNILQVKQCSIQRYQYHTTNYIKFAARYAPEPPYMVREDESVDPKTVRVPYLNDQMRVDIYKKHISDPIQWSAGNLAQSYGASIDRINGVIFLMHQRQELLLSDTKKLLKLINEEVPSDEELIKKINLVTPTLLVPTIVKGFYEYYLQDTTKEPEIILEEYNKICQEKNQSMIQINKKDEIHEVLLLIDNHAKREKDLKDYNEIIEKKMNLYRFNNVDLRAFRETGIATTAFQNKKKNIPGIIDTSSLIKDDDKKKNEKDMNEVEDFNIPQSLLDKYFPLLIDDENVLYEQQKLLRRIQKETQAKVPIYDIKYFTDTFHTNLKEHKDDEHNDDEHKDEEYKEQSNEKKSFPIGQYNKPMRWKLAFRDLSKDPSPINKRRNKDDDTMDSPPMVNRTIICTRSGKLRVATPLEEANRSWRPRPTELDRQLMTLMPFNNKKHIAPYLNYDGDDEIVKQQIDERRERHQLMMADTEAVATKLASLTMMTPKKPKRKSKSKKAKK